MPAHLQVVN